MTLVRGSPHKPTLRTGSVVSDFAAILLGGIGIVGLWDDRPWITFVCLLVLIIALVARGWARLALAEVHYEPVPSSKQLVEGDRFSLSMVAENKKPIPLPWVRLREIIPPGITLAHRDVDETVKTFNGGFEVNETIGLGGYQRANLTVELTASRRGHYTFGPARLRSGDIFGFYQTQQTLKRYQTDLVVFPKLMNLPPIDIPARRANGDTVTRNALDEDISRPNGIREFRAGDSARRIDWKASAKRGYPFVRTFDPSVAHCVVLSVECETNIHAHWGIDSIVLENTVRVAATITSRTLNQGYRVGLVCNGTPLRGETPPVVPPSAGRGQLLYLMNCLAAAGPITTRPLETLIAQNGPATLPFGATIIYVAGAMKETTLRDLASRRAKGNRVLILYTGRADPPDTHGLTLIDLRPFLEGPPL